jgi:hypothetical protein
MLLVDHHYVRARGGQGLRGHGRRMRFRYPLSGGPSRSRPLTLGMTTSRAAPGLEAAAAWSNQTSAGTLSFVSPLVSISEVPRRAIPDGSREIHPSGAFSGTMAFDFAYLAIPVAVPRYCLVHPLGAGLIQTVPPGA